MTNSRRDFIKAGLIGAAAATTGLPESASAGPEHSQPEALNILILGGTGFIGPHMVREALRRGHSVTLFNRGRTNSALFPDIETIKGDRNNGLDGLKGRTWDAVIDNSGYVPRHVQDSARLLAASSSHYLFISTVSVYNDFSKDLDENSPLASIDDETIEEVTGESYGALKALCEQKAAAEYAADDYTVIRPTYIAGPGDHTDRFSYWPIRTRKGGEMLWPGRPSDLIQIVDVRDLANFTIDCLDRKIAGVYNAVNSAGPYTAGKLLEDSQAITATQVEPLWASEEFAYEQGLVASGSFPTWHPGGGALAGGGLFGATASVEAGCHYRAPRETIRDLLAWWDTLGEERQGKLRAGLSAEREAEVIAAWKAANE
ncbi:MAG: NAD-dependent epimerase/dehydratase family protein [Gammaproteobacteria bacterium]|nr:NAD-dependent epimerase/dehydratase family protein [Gammaproteobacteria bacterium]